MKFRLSAGDWRDRVFYPWFSVASKRCFTVDSLTQNEFKTILKCFPAGLSALFSLEKGSDLFEPGFKLLALLLVFPALFAECDFGQQAVTPICDFVFEIVCRFADKG